MSNGRQLFVVAAILTTFGALAVAGGPALDPGTQPVDDTGAVTPDDSDEPNTSSQTGSESDQQASVVHECAATPPADYADPAGNSSEVLGWAEGYWYDEPLAVNASDGLNETEIEMMSARAAARVEALRCLPAKDGVPPVEILSREQFRENQSGAFELSQDRRRADNAALAIRLISNTETDSTEEREQNRGSTVAGTYNFVTEEIVIVSEDPDGLRIDEAVLAHEVGHAIQDQHFDLGQYRRDTLDRDKAILGLIEGDVHYIEQQYRRACSDGGWEQGCLTPQREASGGGGGGGSSGPANWGLYFQTIQPYNDGPAFIEAVYEAGDGWASVNDLYDDPPTSALEVIRPEQYPGFEAVNVTVPDRSSDRFERYEAPYGPSYDRVGIAGISAMFVAPTVESDGAVTIYDPQAFRAQGPLRTYQYYQPETAGWRGDRLYTYRAGNETGAVWVSEWASAEAREPFVAAYEQLIAFRGGEAVGDRIYEFDPDSGYDIALEIRTEGSQVTVVTAPTVEQLDEVHAETGS